MNGGQRKNRCELFHSCGKITSLSSAASAGAHPSTWSLDRWLHEVNKTGQKGILMPEEPALAQSDHISVQVFHIWACSFSTSTVFYPNRQNEGPPQERLVF